MHRDTAGFLFTIFQNCFKAYYYTTDTYYSILFCLLVFVTLLSVKKLSLSTLKNRFDSSNTGVNWFEITRSRKIMRVTALTVVGEKMWVLQSLLLRKLLS